MNLKKKIILLSVAGVIGFQFLVVIFPYKLSNRESWPFLNYPMYSNVRYPGDEIIIRKLFLSAEDNEEIEVNNEDIHVMNRILRVLMKKSEDFLAGVSDDKTSFDKLNYLLRKYFDERFNEAKIVVSKYKMSDKGFENLDNPEIQEHKWAIN